jgi:hypothetical protein
VYKSAPLPWKFCIFDPSFIFILFQLYNHAESSNYVCTVSTALSQVLRHARLITYFNTTIHTSFGSPLAATVAVEGFPFVTYLLTRGLAWSESGYITRSAQAQTINIVG